MAVMTKALAKKLIDQPDKMLEVLDYLQEKKIIDSDEHRSVLLKGFSKLVDLLAKKKVIADKDAKAAMKGGFVTLLDSLS